MILKLVFCAVLMAAYAEKDDKTWVWSNNSRNEGRIRDPKNEISARYEVFENEGAYNTPSFEYNERPDRPIYAGQRPIRPPIINERPGGLYGGDGGYGQGEGTIFHPQQQRPGGPGILTGPIPSWIKEGPIKDFDKCKCTQKFNCNSPGISYGHCDVGKQYCCYSTNKRDQIGGPLPSEPVHSLENGILVGPGGPIDPIPGVNNYPRPPLNGPRPGGNYQRPVGNYLRPGNAGFGVRPVQGHNTYSPENGILVGPGGPYDRPYRGGYNARSAGKE